jgi:hypothetical protein
MGSTEEGSAADMTDERPSSGAPLPFDAVANLRLLAEVQRRGVDAANLVIARLTERTNASGAGGGRPDLSDPADQMANLTDAFIDSVTAVATAMMPAMMPAVDPLRSATTADARHGAAAPEVLSATGAAGESVELELWLHNYTDELTTGIELHSSELVHAGGERLPASCVTVRPSSPFDLTAQSSRSVRLCVDLPDGTSPGSYRGIVTAAHLADLWVVLQVEVQGAQPEVPATGKPPSAPVP